MNTVVMVTMLAGAIIGRAEFADMDTCLKQAEHVRTQSVAAQMAKNFPDSHGEWMDVACTYHVKEPDFSKYTKNLVEILDLLMRLNQLKKSAVVLATHNMSLIEQFPQEVYQCTNGLIVKRPN